MSLAQFLAQLGGGGMGNQAMRQMPGFAGGMFNMDGTIAAPVNGGLRATPEQEAMTAALEARFPNAPAVAYDQSGDTGFSNAPLNPADMVQTPANMMEQIRAAQAAPQMADPFSAASVQPKKDSGLRSFLGNLGDALLIGAGADPIYGPKVKQREMGEAVAQYLGNVDPRLADIARRDPASGVELFKMLREDKRFDRTAGQTDRQLDQTDRSQTETERRNRREEDLTDQGQRLSAATQRQIAELRRQEAAAQRAFEIAMAEGNHARAKELQALGQAYAIQMEALKSGAQYDTVTETTETPAKAASWWSGTPAQPATKTVTERKVPRGGNLDATPTTEGGWRYKPGPGGRANQANWSRI